MKIVFNFRMAISMAALVTALCVGEGAARAEGVYFSTRDLLADFFRTSQNVTYKKLELGASDSSLRARVVKRLGYSPARSSYTFYVATTGGKVDGYALIDEENGEHLPITFAVKLSPAGAVERQEVVCYREARGDEVRDEHFRKQFVGKTTRDPITVDQDIVAISGATISSRAMAVGVRRAIVLLEELVKPVSLSAGAVTTVEPSGRRPGKL
jgi:electron transport complex protein RnfG